MCHRALKPTTIPEEEQGEDEEEAVAAVVGIEEEKPVSALMWDPLPIKHNIP
jgi:hypothetical protein